MSLGVRLVSLLGLASLSLTQLCAQGTPRATLVGTVADGSGAIVVGAEVVTVNEGTSIQNDTQTDSNGGYTIPNLPVGDYRVSATHPGFKKAVVEHVRLQVGAAFRADIVLEVGEVSNQVQVEAVTPLLKTESAEVSHVVEQKRIVELPLNGRDFQQLQLLMPGTVSTTNYQTTAGLSGGAAAAGTNGTLNVTNGSRPGSQLFMLDGAYASNRQGRTIIVTPSVDEIEEFRISGSNFSAEYGYGTNVVNVATKSGTNRFHGTLWEFHRNSAVAARSFFSRNVDVLKRNQFGGLLGGPIKKNRTFFLLSYEGQRQRTTTTLIPTVPTARMRQGDLSELGVPIYDPATSRINDQNLVARDVFPGNRIPSARIDPVSSLFLQWVPLPNAPGVAGNFFNAPGLFDDYNQWTVRVDHRLTERDSLFARVTHRGENYPNSISPYHGFSKDNYSPSTTYADIFGTSAVLSWTHTFNPTATLEVRPSYAAPLMSYSSPNFGVDWTTKAGIQGFGPGVSDIFPTFPSFSYAGFTGLPNNDGFSIKHNTRDVAANLTMVRSAHLMKVGYAFASYQEGIFPYGTGEGSFSYTGAYTSNPAAGGTGGSGLGDYLLGIPFSGGRYVPPGKYYMQLRNSWSYFQDDWKVSQRLTLNLGIRYEINFPTTEKYDQLATFVGFARNGHGAMVVPDEASISSRNYGLHSSVPLSIGTYRPLIVTAKEVGLPTRSMRPTNFHEFVPRFGAAYRVSKDFTVRGGYGIYLNQLDGNRETEFLSPPFLIRESGVLNAINANGAPTLTTQTLFPNDSKFGAQPSILGHDPYARDYGYTQQWNLTLQKLLPGSFSLETSYVGTKGTRLQTSRNINAPPPGPGAIQPRRPYPDFLGITWNEQSASSIYHAFQGKLERRFQTGFTFLSSFTWSKSIDNSSESSQGCTNPYDCRYNRGVSSFDLPFRFVASGIYELPTLRKGSHPALVKHALGGWSVTAILTLQSGFPYTPAWSGDPSNTGLSARPKRVCSGTLDNPTVDRWFDTSCFVAPDAFTFGNTGRNILRGDGLQNLDFGVYKNFAITEASRLQFRSEFYNGLNHPDFTFPSTTVNAPGAGRVFGSSAGRIIQFSLKYNF